MAIKQKLGKLACGVLAAIGIGSVANAESPEDTARARFFGPQITNPDNSFKIPLNNPMANADANAQAVVLANKLAGKGIEFIGEKTKLDNGIGGRAGLILGNGYLAELLGTVSHEYGHVRAAEDAGLNPSVHIDFAGVFSPNTSSYVSVRPSSTLFGGGNGGSSSGSSSGSGGGGGGVSDEDSLRFATAGLNQNALNSRELLEQNVDIGVKTVNGAILGFIERNAGLAYHYSDRDNGLGDKSDLSAYVTGLERKGIDMSKGRDFAESGVAAGISLPHNVSDALVVWNYLVHGKKASKVPTIRVKGVDVAWPSAVHFRTPEGGFIDTQTYVGVGKDNPVRLDVGAGVSGDNDVVRIGGKVYDLPISRARLSPYAHVNVDRSDGSIGGNAGVEVKVPLTKNASLGVDVGYASNDVVSDVKGEDGFNANVGLEVGF